MGNAAKAVAGTIKTTRGGKIAIEVECDATIAHMRHMYDGKTVVVDGVEYEITGVGRRYDRGSTHYCYLYTDQRGVAGDDPSAVCSRCGSRCYGDCSFG